MIIHKLIIVDYKNKTANEFNFSDKANIITSDETTIGKSSLIKSIYYALGFAVKQIPHGWNIETMRFRLDLSINNSSYYIIRDSTLFYVSDFEKPLNEKEFAEWLEEKLSIKMQLKLKGSSDNKLSSVYASEIITPFYLDQDKSWNGYLFKNTSDTLNRYSNVQDDLMKFVLGLSSNEILDKENQIRINNSEINRLRNESEILKKLQEDYSKKVKMMDTSLFNLDKLKETFKNNLKHLSTLSNEISVKRKEIMSKKQEKDMFIQDNIELEKLLQANKKSYREVESECIYCHSKLTLEQSITRLKLSNNMFEIQNMIEMNRKRIEKLDGEIDNLLEDISRLNEVYENFKKEKEKIQDALTLQEYIQLESKRLANQEFINKINTLIINEDELRDEQKILNKELRQMKNAQKEKLSLIKSRFSEIIKDINLSFGSDLIKDKELFDFREIKGSGMDNNKSLLALYIGYLRLVIEYGVYSIPIGIDSFVKNEVDKKTIEITFKELEKYILSSDYQTFFVAITENLEYLSGLNEYHLIKLTKPILNSENYVKLVVDVEVGSL